MSSNNLTFEFDNKNSKMILPKDKVIANITDKKITDSIYFIKSNLIFKEDLVVESKSKIDGIMLDFNLSGDITYHSKISNHRLQTFKNRTDIELVNEEETESFVKKGEVNKITLVVKKELLSQILPDCEVFKILNYLEKNNCHKILSSKLTGNNVNKLLNQLHMNELYVNDLNTLFLQSKVLELIYYEFNTLFTTKDNKQMIKFSEEDMQALKKAKVIINSLDANCTISYLSKRVALNEFKLKYGFKKFFNTSPGALVLETRMQKAKELLSTGDYNIAEVSSIVGYKHQQSFSTAFFKYFKVNPKELVKNRTYYF